MMEESESAVFATRVESARGAAAAVIVVVEGELDLLTSPRLIDVVSGLNGPGKNGPVVLDLAGVRFIDSSGLRALLDAERAASGAGRAFALAQPSDTVRRLLELVDLVGQMTVLEDLEPAALARVS